MNHTPSWRAFKRGGVDLKRHTVVVRRYPIEKRPRFYEVIDGNPLEPCYMLMAQISEETGEIRNTHIIDYDSISIDDVEPIAPTHPVYIKWAARRLADRLEGLNRT